MKMLQGLHIGFTGIDGAGKTTQMGLLYSWTRDEGINTVKYEETRNFVSEVSFAIGHRLGFSSGQAYMGEDYYIIAMAFEVLRKNILKIRPYTQLGALVISSRTVFDWLAGTMARGSSQEAYQIAETVILAGGTPDVTIWLDTDPKIAQQRIQERGYDKASLDFLEKFRTALINLSSRYQLLRIDGDDDKFSVHKKIMSQLTATLRNPKNRRSV